MAFYSMPRAGHHYRNGAGGRVTRLVFEKVAQNVVQPFLSILIHDHGKSSPKIYATFVIYQNCPQYLNNHPMCENLPTLVALARGRGWGKFN
jgi:hypothetical protein